MKQPDRKHIDALKTRFNAFLRNATDSETRVKLLQSINVYLDECEKVNRPKPSPVIITDDEWRKAGYPD